MDFIGDIDLLGLLSVIIFYFVILGVGMWAAQKKSNVEGVSEEVSAVHHADFSTFSRKPIVSITIRSNEHQFFLIFFFYTFFRLCFE